MKIKLSARLPGEDRDGLSTLRPSLSTDPAQQQVIVAIVEAREVRRNYAADEETVTLRLHAVEGLSLDTEEGQRAHTLWHTAYCDRTGKVPLPFDDPVEPG